MSHEVQRPGNFVPENVVDLEVETELSLEDTPGDHKLLRSFFETGQLPLDVGFIGDA